LARRFGKWILYGVFAMLVLISNLMAGKLICIGPAIVPAVVAIYAVTFLCTDAVCEMYGREEGKKVVFGGFLANILALPLIYLVVAWPSAPIQVEAAAQFDAVFGLAPRIILASMTAYLISQTHDVYVYSWYKQRTKGRFMWFRNNMSTIVSQLIDSNIFIFLAFYGVLPLPIVLEMIVFQWIIKVGIALADTPFLYLTVSTVKRISPIQTEINEKHRRE
jgi:uncharacterized integral membrane protein (TIGR00697 family)